MGFNENLKEAMLNNNMTANDLSQKTGIKVDTIYSYLKTNGPIPSADKAFIIADTLDVTVEYLVTGRICCKEYNTGILKKKDEIKKHKTNVDYKRLYNEIIALPEDIRVSVEDIVLAIKNAKEPKEKKPAEKCCCCD